MKEIEILNLWKSYDKKLDETLHLNRKNAEDILHLKIRSAVFSMKPIKIFTIICGILWVILVDGILLMSFSFASPFFIVSMGLQVLLTKAAIFIYLYQLIIIHQIDVSQPVLQTQEKLARLQSSTLWVTRLLFLQLPLWTTFYLSKGMLLGSNFYALFFQLLITFSFLYLALWLFINIKAENMHKKWFKFIFNGKEWTPVIKSLEMLNETAAFKNEGR
ncbi:MAG: hypothetical protein IPJ79_00630 [Bacteroidetes bacterium]|nr:hypothetical protein [Bacteroidota bacterium]